MKLPKHKKRYCPYCKKHTEHTVSTTKKKNPGSMTYGSKVRARRRGRARGKGNLGRYSKPAISKFKMTGKKSTKKTDLRYECKICKKIHVQMQGFRARKIEFK
jgi:large subunit ribosomal protein L44e